MEKVKKLLLPVIIIIILLLPIIVNYVNNKKISVISYDKYTSNVSKEKVTLTYFGDTNSEEYAKIKEELLNELKQNSLETQSIVGQMSQKPIKQDDTVNLSSRESRIAKAMGMTPSEYAKWR